MPRSPYILVKTDDRLSKALRACAAHDNMIHSEYARILCSIPLGVKNPAMEAQFQELLKRHPRVNRLAALEAAWEFYVKLVMTYGLDGDFYPRLPSEAMPHPTTETSTAPPAETPPKMRHKHV